MPLDRAISRPSGVWGTSLNLSLPVRRAQRAVSDGLRTWLALAVALLLAVGLSVLLARLMMAPRSDQLAAMAAYFALSGAGTLSAGGLALHLADRAFGFSIRAKVFFGTSIGTAV